jgi:hypothetical protein
MKIFYSNGDSVVWGAELENKQTERYSSIVSNLFNWVDCNNASAGVSNDYIFRQTMRDVSHWLDTKKCWSEESGWIKSDELFVCIGWTSPTRFEWWEGKQYQQERLWTGYDKWGDNDKNRTTEDEFILNQTEDLPSYIRTLNHIISLGSFLQVNNIPYCFYNVFYDFKTLKEPKKQIDNFGRKSNQTSLKSLWKQIPNFKDESMYEYIHKNGGTFLPRNHPTKISHKLWANYLYKRIKDGV